MRKIAVVALAIFALLCFFRANCEHRPTVPIKPIGPVQTWVGVADTYRTSSIYSGGGNIKYIFDFDEIQDSSVYAPSGETVGVEKTWNNAGTYEVKAMARAEDGTKSYGWSDPLHVTVGPNRKPGAPDPIRIDPVLGWYSDSFALSSRAHDTDGDSVYIKFFYDADSNLDWNSGWRGPAPSDSSVYDTVGYPHHHHRDVPYRIFALARERKSGPMGLISDTSPASYISVSRPPMGWRYPRSGEEQVNGDWDYSPALLALPGGDVAVFAPSGCCETVNVFIDHGSSQPDVYGRVFDPGFSPVAAGAPALSADHQRFYVPVGDDRLYCLSAGTDLTILSRFPDDLLWNGEFATPAVFGENLYAGQGDSFKCLRDRRGTLEFVWGFYVGSEVSFPAVVSSDGSRVFFASDSGLFYCLDNTGQEQWRCATGGSVTSGAAIDDNGVVYVGRADGRVYGYSPGDSVPTYSTEASLVPARGCPVIGWGGTVYVVRQDGSVAAYPSQGQGVGHIWQSSPLPPTDWVEAAPCLAPDTTIVVHSEDDVLYSLRLADGSEKWRVSLPTGRRAARVFSRSDDWSSPTVGPGLRGIYVAGNGSPFFFCLAVDYDAYDNGLPNTPWPKFQHDISNSGCKGGTWSY